MKRWFWPGSIVFFIVGIAFPSTAYCQTDKFAAVRQELAEDRQQLNVIIRNQPPPAKIISIPGETNQERAQRHDEAIRDARESWKTEWSQEHPFKSSYEAPPMPDEMRNDAIRDSDAKYIEEHSKANPESTFPRPAVQSPQVAQLKARIAALERILSQGRGNTGRLNSDLNQPPSRQARLAVAWKSIKVGMKQAEVVAALGKPNGSTGDHWLYSGCGIIGFDSAGLVQTLEPQFEDPSR